MVARGNDQKKPGSGDDESADRPTADNDLTADNDVEEDTVATVDPDNAPA